MFQQPAVCRVEESGALVVVSYYSLAYGVLTHDVPGYGKSETRLTPSVTCGWCKGLLGIRFKSAG